MLVNGSGTDLTVRVENDRSAQGQPDLHGGWLVEATLPGSPAVS